jgi:hypothetical protein
MSTRLAATPANPAASGGSGSASGLHLLLKAMLRRLVLPALVVLALAGCVTPTVPIPPPDPESMTFALDTEAGLARYAADPNVSYAGAVVFVYNRDRGLGVITTAADDGSVAPTEPFAGDDGDDIVVTYEIDTQAAATCVVLHDGRSSSAFECRL